jgi:hypothetical protein
MVARPRGRVCVLGAPGAWAMRDSLSIERYRVPFGVNGTRRTGGYDAQEEIVYA